MTIDSHDLPDPLYRLVRATLEADAREVDVPRLEAAITARMAAPLGPESQFVSELGSSAPQLNDKDASAPRNSRRRLLRSGMAAAACLAVAGGTGYLLLSGTPASAYSLVHSAQLALAQSSDRCYRIAMQAPKGWPFLAMDDTTLLWTRGDRYRVIMDRGGKSRTWGQDELGRIWLVYSADRGLLYEPREIPPQVAAAFSYLNLDLRQLAGTLLQDCDLQLESSGRPRSENGVATVRATVKRGKNVLKFEAANLDIDVRTKVIRRLELRLLNHKENGRMQFTFVEELPQSDDSYRVESHLAPNGKVLGRSRRSERGKLLLQMIAMQSRR